MASNVGNSDDDILVAGYTAYDSDSHALAHILEEWTSGGSYASRVANIKTGGGLTGGFRLNGDDGVNQTVFNDNDADTLTGSSGLDAFWANLVADNGGALDKSPIWRAANPAATRTSEWSRRMGDPSGILHLIFDKTGNETSNDLGLSAWSS